MQWLVTIRTNAPALITAQEEANAANALPTTSEAASFPPAFFLKRRKAPMTEGSGRLKGTGKVKTEKIRGKAGFAMACDCRKIVPI